MVGENRIYIETSISEFIVVLWKHFYALVRGTRNTLLI